MTGERTMPGGPALEGYWTPGSGGWGGDGGVDENWRKIGAGLASRLVVESRTTDPLPAAPAGPVVYIVASGDATNPNKIAVWDGPAGSEAWVYYAPYEGLQAYVKDGAEGSKNVLYDGAAWSVETIGFSGAKATRAANQAVSASVSTVVAWDAEEYDTAAYHDPATNNDRVTIPVTGKYRVTFANETDTEASGTVWQCWITKNGTTFADRIAYADKQGALKSGAPVVFEGVLAAGDILRAMVFCSQATNLLAQTSFLSIQKIG